VIIGISVMKNERCGDPDEYSLAVSKCPFSKDWIKKQ